MAEKPSETNKPASSAPPAATNTPATETPEAKAAKAAAEKEKEQKEKEQSIFEKLGPMGMVLKFLIDMMTNKNEKEKTPASDTPPITQSDIPINNTPPTTTQQPSPTQAKAPSIETIAKAREVINNQNTSISISRIPDSLLGALNPNPTVATPQPSSLSIGR